MPRTTAHARLISLKKFISDLLFGCYCLGFVPERAYVVVVVVGGVSVFIKKKSSFFPLLYGFSRNRRNHCDAIYLLLLLSGLCEVRGAFLCL